jgi:hypothetical protein
LAGGTGFPRPIGESVKLAGANIGLELTIPRFGVKRGEPLPQLRHCLGRQALDFALDLLNLAHLGSVGYRGFLTANEGGLFAAGVAIYVRHAPARDRVGAVAFWSLIGTLVIAYLGNAFGPPPPGVAAIAYVGIAGGVLFAVWAWWADRHRGTLRP